MPHPFKPHPHIPVCFNFTLYVCAEYFHIRSIDVPASVGAPHSTHNFIDREVMVMFGTVDTYLFYLMHNKEGWVLNVERALCIQYTKEDTVCLCICACVHASHRWKMKSYKFLCSTSSPCLKSGLTELYLCCHCSQWHKHHCDYWLHSGWIFTI